MFDLTHFSPAQWFYVPLIIFGRYVLYCALPFIFFYAWKRREQLFRKIQQHFPRPTDYQREILHSALTSVIFAFVTWCCLGTSLREYTLYYSEADRYGWWWLALSVPLTLLIHDAYFYWIHRLMHQPPLYRRIHLLHHKSVNPSPWAAYAFHPVEAVLEAGIVPLLLFALPLHPLSFWSFVTLMLVFNVYGHLGYELFPKKMYTHPLGRWLNSSVHHNLHHEKFHGNYGLYFTIWDRLCGTLRRDSMDKVEALHTRIRAQKERTGLKFKHFLPLFLPAFFSTTAGAQATVNWATDVAPILYENCAKCHRDGGIGHFSLIGYGNAAANSFAIMNATQTRKMPPWKPDPAYRRFAHERRLTDEQIQTIQDWVFAGSPAGDLNQAPPDPVFVSGSNVGTPDHVLTTPLYTVTATEDEYRCFVIPNGLNQTAYLRGLEAIPGNHEVVHHILIYEDTTGQAQVLDSQTPEPGYVNFGGTGVSGSRLIGAWVPGSTTILTPPFMGMKLTPGADLIVQMHYPKGVTGMSDMTTLNFFFTPNNQNIREIRLAPLINHTPLSLENWPLFIPANQVKTYHAKFQTPIDGSVLSVAPHMHLIGRSMVCFAVTPQNDTIPLIRINDWDFHWQGGYFFQKIQKVPANSTVHAYAVYDNTPNNPFQPSNPPQLVTQGEATTDEMLLVYFAFLEYQPGDEDIVLDSTLLSTAVPFVPEPGEGIWCSVFPNPANDQADFAFEILETTDIQASISDLNGRILKIFAEKQGLTPGIYRETADLGDLPPGVYVARIQTSNGKSGTTKVVKNH